MNESFVDVVNRHYLCRVLRVRRSYIVSSVSSGSAVVLQMFLKCTDIQKREIQ